jgi:hypothetical protein
MVLQKQEKSFTSLHPFLYVFFVLGHSSCSPLEIQEGQGSLITFLQGGMEETTPKERNSKTSSGKTIHQSAMTRLL